MNFKRLISNLLFLALCNGYAWCQDTNNIIHGLEISAEAQYSHSDGKTPLWLNANKYGLSSLQEDNGYFRVSAIRPVETDSDRNWKIGYGVDIAATENYTSKLIVNQAYGVLAYKKIALSIGSKYRVPALTNQALSSGAMVYGWNSRSIPQAALDIDWFSFPGTKGWWTWKIHGSFGMTTDGNWQKSVVPETEHYTGNVLYHEKALYWKFGKEDPDLFPLTFEMGLQFASVFGGKTYNFKGRVYTDYTDIEHPENFKAFVNVLTCSGSDENDGSSKNTAGNHVGSWNMRLAWHDYDWSAALRFERFFEDQSMMFVQYGIYDHLLGIDVNLPANQYVSSLTLEHLSTRDQSGAVMHDAATNIPDKMNGMDNYYNHSMYAGYSLYGQTMGNPLLTSPIYNENGSLVFSNNRLTAWHIGMSGSPLKWLSWRMLATFTRNWGSYDAPLEDPTNQQYYMLEANLHPIIFKGWNAVLGIGYDHGKLIGNNTGVQVTIRKKFTL